MPAQVIRHTGPRRTHRILAFGPVGGTNFAVLFEVLECNVANSGLTKLKGQKLRTADFAPQFSVKHLCKDLRLAVETAGAAALPETTLVRDRLREAERRGWADEDISALLKLL